jgi:hypothetical protein
VKGLTTPGYYKTFRDTWKSNNPGSNLNASFDKSKTKTYLRHWRYRHLYPGYEMSKEERATKKYPGVSAQCIQRSFIPDIAEIF